MPQALADLESQRSSLLQQFLTLGDFRPGHRLRRGAPLRKTQLSLRPAR